MHVCSIATGTAFFCIIRSWLNDSSTFVLQSLTLQIFSVIVLCFVAFIAGDFILMLFYLIFSHTLEYLCQIVLFPIEFLSLSIVNTVHMWNVLCSFLVYSHLKSFCTIDWLDLIFMVSVQAMSCIFPLLQLCSLKARLKAFNNLSW